MKHLMASFALVVMAVPVWAGTRSVTLSVPGMTCAACPITVKTALARVDGVAKAEVSYEKREARVTFDDSRTGVQALLKASANAGYPATIRQ